eukprot:scaffold4007_cov49-Cyclotella_meneghiniana.AAC.2
MTKEKSDDLNDSEVAELEELDVVGEPADMVDNDNVGKLCCFARWFGKGGGEGRSLVLNNYLNFSRHK